MKKFIVMIALLCSLIFSISSAFGDRSHRPAEGTAARLFYDRMVYIMGNLRDTEYVHLAEKVINEDDGIYKYDCSGFVGEFILQQTLSAHYQDLFDNAERFHSVADSIADKRPRAWGFYDYFKEILGDEVENSNAYWYVFKSYEKIQPGDIIVAKYHEDWQKYLKDEKECASVSTGHVMLAWSFPVISTVNTDEFWIYIIDSSGSGHGKDTRKTDYDNVNDEEGIGKGKMWYGFNTKTTTDGKEYHRPIYYRWSAYDGCKYTLHSMTSNCGYETGDVYYCPGDPYSSLNHKYFERLQGIIMARPVGNIPAKGDINNDGKVGLEEAIHALQVTSGENSQ